MKKALILLSSLIIPICLLSQETRYLNPIINEDYSDPDVVEAADGRGFYLTASSFASTPALPVLFSEDLVNWNIINYAVDTLMPKEFYDGQPKQGKGVWASSRRQMLA